MGDRAASIFSLFICEIQAHFTFLKREFSCFEDKCKSLYIFPPVCCSCLPPPCVRVCWTTSCLSVLPPRLAPFPSRALFTSPFFSGWVRGGPLRLFVSLAQHCHSGYASMSSWNHHCISFSSLPSITCSLILYRIFVCHPYSCQPLFSLIESITLDCRLICQSSCGRLSFSMTCHPLPNCQTSGFPESLHQPPPITGEHIPEPVLAVCCQPLAGQHLEIAAAGRE